MKRAPMLAGVAVPLLTIPWLATAWLLTGCQGACATATDLCIECGRPPEECERLFSGANHEFCQEAVATYENNCKDVPQQE